PAVPEGRASVAPPAPGAPPALPRRHTPRLALVGAGVVASVLLLLGAAWLMNRRAPATERLASDAPSREEDAGAPAGREGGKGGASARPAPPLSEVALRDGTLHVRLLRLDVNPEEALAEPGEKPAPPRWVVVSNKDDAEKWPGLGSTAR